MPVTLKGIFKKFIFYLPLKIINKIKEHNLYKKRLQFYANFIQEDDLCFDIGAHHGNRTEIFLKLGARVVAVDAQEDCTKFIGEKFPGNQKLILVNKGVADVEGELPFYICEKASTISTFSNDWKKKMSEEEIFSKYDWNKTKKVPVTTLDQLINTFGMPKFCKIDVEGFELEVLKGLTQPIKYLSFEFQRLFLANLANCINHIESLGSVVFNYSIAESMEFVLPQWISADELYKEIESVKDNSFWGDVYIEFLM